MARSTLRSTGETVGTHLRWPVQPYNVYKPFRHGHRYRRPGDDATKQEAFFFFGGEAATT
jgi:hypothetical protein